VNARALTVDASMLDLYRIEAEDQTQVLTTRLLALERTPTAPEHLEACMRAAHSLKGAARIIGFEEGVRVAHAMEDCFVAAQRGDVLLNQEQIDAFLRDVDLLKDPTSKAASDIRPDRTVIQTRNTDVDADGDERMLRVTAEHLNQLLRLAGESLVEARRRKQGEEHAHRLYEAALACRMRPFKDGVRAFPRVVRDLSRLLGKLVRLEIRGEATQVDRDILARLEAPLSHLLRNALDHGIEPPPERAAEGKSEEGVITLEARHSAGTLLVSVIDDGRGISLEQLRESIIRRSLAPAETAQRLSESELLEFLFLPGFTLKDAVTEISGRGVGLDAVQDMLKQVRGNVRVTTTEGKGTRFQLQLPLTLSVERTLLVEIGDEPYALPLAQVGRAMCIPRTRIEYLEGRPHFFEDGRCISLVDAALLLGDSTTPYGEETSVLVLGSGERSCALVVDRFIGEQELVVQPLDRRLGKVQDVSAAAVMEDGGPVLILDVEDLMRSAEKLVREGARVAAGGGEEAASGAGKKSRRRVLVVDDSLTVRELERKVLSSAGYEVDVATNGVDGWNAVRAGKFDLVVTDIDMPRMDGIEFVGLIRKDPHLKSLPVMIVSYKDRPEDRRRGLEAGADHYLAKASFHDDALIGAVRELLGEPAEAPV
jgi:two-component system sensor histidine kinase and response regulator WspE